MSHLVTDISRIKDHHTPNFVESVRVVGTILDYDALNGHITVRSLNTLSGSQETIKLIMDDDLELTDPQLCYVGTTIDVNGLYDGENVRMISVRVVDMDLDKEDIKTLKYISNLQNNAL